MNLHRRTLTTLMTIAFSLLPLTAAAHIGQGEHGFIDGFAHPFFGLDHLLAMLLVGIWSILNSRRIWLGLAPIIFITLLAVGVLFGQHGGMAVPIEPLVAASVLMLGLFLAKPNLMTGSSVALVLIGGAAFFHGLAHGSEVSAGSTALIGILTGSAVLHAFGMAIAHLWLNRRPLLTLRLGQFMTAVGGGLVLNAIL